MARFFQGLGLATQHGSASIPGMNMKKILAAAGIGAALIAGPLLDISPAHADVFTMCPSGHEGVVGGHTTCAFAENVQRVFLRLGHDQRLHRLLTDHG
jgi:hypothetical protein